MVFSPFLCETFVLSSSVQLLGAGAACAWLASSVFSVRFGPGWTNMSTFQLNAAAVKPAPEQNGNVVITPSSMTQAVSIPEDYDLQAVPVISGPTAIILNCSIGAYTIIRYAR